LGGCKYDLGFFETCLGVYFSLQRQLLRQLGSLCGLDPFHLGGLRSWLEFTKATWSFMMKFHEGNLEIHEGNLEFHEGNLEFLEGNLEFHEV